jgi:hypothetical protein
VSVANSVLWDTQTNQSPVYPHRAFSLLSSFVVSDKHLFCGMVPKDFCTHPHPTEKEEIMNTKKTQPTLTFQDILAAARLPADYQLPTSVQQLPAKSQRKLLADPLTAVPRRHSVYSAQRDLLASFTEPSSSNHLRRYCQGICRLSPAGWKFMVKAGKPNYVKVPSARADGTISDMDGQLITSIYNHWIDLQHHVGLADHIPKVPVFASRRTVGR